VGYGANMFYYVRNDVTGLSWFGTINPTPGLVATDRYTVGTNFDALVYVSLSPIPGWGTDYFAYLRHDNTGSIIGTIDPVTHVPRIACTSAQTSLPASPLRPPTWDTEPICSISSARREHPDDQQGHDLHH